MSRFRKWAAAVAALALVAGLGWLAGTALTARATDNTINACVRNGVGVLRVPADGESCGAGETPLSWNIQGQKGEKGDAGPQGPAGPAGAGIASFEDLEGLPCTLARRTGTVSLSYEPTFGTFNGSVKLGCEVPNFLSIEPAYLEFHGSGDRKSFAITNHAPFQIDSLELEFVSEFGWPHEFIDSSCTGFLDAGTSCTFLMEFQPPSVGGAGCFWEGVLVVRAGWPDVATVLLKGCVP